jgi:tetratricopeptide (TPR) repeat protein
MRSAIIASLLAASAGCVITPATYTKDGVTYGEAPGAFRGRWYNHYQRGLSYLEGGYYEDAARDFERALELRPSDQRRARTYGLHFIDYFPNRELGITYLALGQLERAQGLLATSLEHVDSGRAEYFVNEVRRQILVSQGVADATPPAFELPGLDGTVVKKRGLRLIGRVSDPSLVRAVSINGRLQLIPVAAESFAIDAELDLLPGANTISIVAEDLFGNRAALAVSVIVDAAPPVVSIDDLREQNGQLWLFGSLEDLTRVVALRSNGQAVVLPAGAPRPTFSLPVSSDELVLEAEDAAGNVTTVRLDPKTLLARMAAADADPPVIEVGTVPATLHAEELFLDGAVWDRSQVQSFRLEVNGQDVGELAGSGRRTAYFRQVIKLQVGKNRLVLRAQDDQGRGSEKVIEVVRAVPPLELPESRLAVAMAPFIGSSTKAEARAAAEQSLENALVEQRRFFVLDRSRINDLVTEWQLVATDLAKDGPDLMKLGETMGADVTMLGWVQESGAAIEVYARLVDGDTGAILVEKDVFHEKKSLRNLQELLYGLGLKLQAALPIVRGVVQQTDGEALTVDMPDGRLLPPGARLLVVRAAPSLGAATIVGEARIERVEGAALAATLLSGQVVSGSTVVTK